MSTIENDLYLTQIRSLRDEVRAVASKFGWIERQLEAGIEQSQALERRVVALAESTSSTLGYVVKEQTAVSRRLRDVSDQQVEILENLHGVSERLRTAGERQQATGQRLQGIDVKLDRILGSVG